MKKQLKAGSIKLPGGKKLKDRIEDHIQLEDYVRFLPLKGDVGAALQSNGQDYQFKFGFMVESFSPNESEEQFDTAVEYLQNALKSIPDNESMTFIQSVVPDNKPRLQYFGDLYRKAPSPLFAEMVKSAASPGEYFINMGLEDRVNLARSKYKRKTLTIYVTATSTQSAFTKDKSEAFIKKGIETVAGVWEKITGEAVREQSEQIIELFTNAQAIYEDWVNVLDQMQLPVTPMSVEALVNEQWREFNDTPVRPIPQIMEWDGERLHYQMEDDIHLTSWLFERQSNVPRAKRDYVYQTKLDGKQRVTGIVTLRNKPSGWKSPKHALKYLYDKTRGLHDYKIVFTLTKASRMIAEKNVEMLQRQAQDAISLANKRGLPSTRSKSLQAEAEAAAEALYSGNIPMRMSLCFLVSARSKKELNILCRRLVSKFPSPATLEIEQDYTPLTWLQCFPQLSYKRPLFSPYDRTRSFNVSSIPAFLPIVKATSPDTKGLEFVTEDEGTPFYLDIINVQRHILFLAKTRAGKSVLFSFILLIAMCSQVPMVVVDYPKEDGNSTFGPIAKLAGEHGAYLNIAEEANNFLELPDLSAFSGEALENRMIATKDYVLDLLMIIMFGPNASDGDQEKRTARDILSNLMNRFYRMPDINRRFQAAIGAKIGSPEWRDVPTLHDFTKLCTESTLKEFTETVAPEHIKLINEIRLRYSAFVETTVGRSLSQPTSIPRDANLLVFAFKGISSNDDAAVLMASAAAAAMRRTLSAPVSILFMDEASILSKFDSLMEQIAKIAANGFKSGIRLMMALQTPASIAKSRFGDEILANIGTKVIGRIEPGDAKHYTRILDIPSEYIRQNASKKFFPKIAELYSRWMIIDNDDITFVRSYAPPLLLAAVANNPEEEVAKEAFLAAYPDNPTRALQEFAKEFILAAQENRAIAVPDVDTTAKPTVHLDKVEENYALAS
ncbi:hypothetical protein S7335_1237 [Synechococcus sp. PCC 7335]|uniref:ATP-binding protein n=1 Tax=Synechococcus sp. (strain ATCC 29403 / PCC 7335) TaxID=91464 RepID=UPI00017EB1BF|nr:ATP-binding protein [Synechococcus sp. PCC 7335]EDX82533.1 hypothetical protein S7335_1237 [Synechococcus sp. PCC 7335]